MQKKDDKSGCMRFEAKEHADKYLAAADAETSAREFDLPDDGGKVSLKLTRVEGEEEKQAWKSYREKAAARDAREAADLNKRRGGRGGGGRAKRGRT